MLIPELGDPVAFYQRHFKREWWISYIQSYPQCRIALKGEGLHQHHLIPQSLFKHAGMPDLADYVPSVPFSEAEHLKTLHYALNKVLKAHDLWQRDLSRGELERAIELTAKFYEQHGLRHFAAAIRGFRKEAFEKVNEKA